MSFFQNTCKLEGLGGKIMVTTMNIGGHAALAKWGLSHLILESDLATAFETVYFWHGLPESFSQAYRVLRDDGRFFICNEYDGDNPADTKWEQMIQGMKIYKEDEIVASLKQAGFSGVTVHRNQEKHWICFIAEK